MVIAGPRVHRVLGIRLRPAGAYALLRMPMREVTDLTLNLAELVGPAADELAERCHAAPSVEERFAIAARWIVLRVAESRAVEPEIAWSAAAIERTGGGVPIGALRAETGFSKTRLAAGFREQIGVTPKLYARIVRFRRLLELLDRGGAPLVDVALEAGFYDQPHMALEFRELAGVAPREFLASRYPGGITTAESA
jgi:AraC-like DNA-binding protein